MNEIKNIRKDFGLTQKELSEKTKVPIRTIQEWEQNRRKPPEYVVWMIKKLLKGESL